MNMSKSEHMAPHIERVFAGLLAISADALRAMPRDQALNAINEVEHGSYALSFNVTMTGLETVVVSRLVDVATGASHELAHFKVAPPAAIAPTTGLH